MNRKKATMAYRSTLICSIPWRVKQGLEELSRSRGVNVSDQVNEALIQYMIHNNVDTSKYVDPPQQNKLMRGRKPYMRNKIASEILEMLLGSSMLSSEIVEAIKGHSVRSIRGVLAYLERAERIFRTKENGKVRWHTSGA
jgi:hypothetical protein